MVLPVAQDLITVCGSDTVWRVRHIDDEFIFMTGIDERLDVDDDVLVQVRVIGMRTFLRDSTWELVRPAA